MPANKIMINFKQKQKNLIKSAGVIQDDFPKEIGNFIFLKKFFPDKVIKSFNFAIYENKNGKKAIAKQWNRSCKWIDYHWLNNEINVYKEINRIIANNPEVNRKYPNMHIPELLDVVREKNVLIMLIEKIEGESIKTTSTREQVSIFQNVIEYLNFLGSMMESSGKKVLIKRNMWYVATTSIFISVLAILKHPKKTLSILHGLLFLSLNIFKIFDKNDMIFAHRDLQPDHIIMKDDNFWIIDFQISAITNKAFDLAGLMIFMWNSSDFCDMFEKNYIIDFLSKDKNNFYVYKALSIHLALYNLGILKEISFDQVFSYLNYALNLKKILITLDKS